MDDAARIAVETVRASTSVIDLVTFVLFSDEAFGEFAAQRDRHP